MNNNMGKLCLIAFIYNVFIKMLSFDFLKNKKQYFILK